MIKNIIFNWAGILVNDSLPHYAAVSNVFEQIGIKQISFNEFKEKFTVPIPDFYKKFIPNPDMKRISKIFLEEITKVGEPQLFPGTKEILDYLRSKKIKMVVITALPKEKLKTESKNFGLKKYFIKMTGGLQGEIEKTFLETLKENKFNPKETAVISDKLHYIDLGKKAGLITIAVSWGYQSRKRLAEKNPDFIIDNIKDLKRIIK